MKRVAVLFANGFEEVEALTVVDMLRRLNIGCDMVGFDEEVEGSHGIRIKADKLISTDFSNYDAVVLPGGLPGSTNLRDSDLVLEIVRSMHEEGKIVAAICAAPMVLEAAGILKGKKCTSYPGVAENFEDVKFKSDMVVKDGNIITSRGVATALAFSFAIAEALGVDTRALKEGVLYDKLMTTWCHPEDIGLTSEW